ncbi:uncharacterized protein MESR3 isoform X1 [Halyomorpha halys]|uniref:uncharacterized protein MESR3 isoform X1 n=2 Tax=Halyomorpha halys TaxID=286706 RepID=UPI0006D516EC|nr:uncharacterized protein LOC106685560 isoform X1 [Halyomorpha halys]
MWGFLALEGSQQLSEPIPWIMPDWPGRSAVAAEDGASSTSSEGAEIPDQERSQIESCFRALSTQVFVCGSMVNLYTSRGGDGRWNLQATGVPVVLLDTGEARSRTSRGIRLVLAERGSSFCLWSDKIDNLSAYRVSGPSFHTMCLSSDHSTFIGLSFDSEFAARELWSHIEQLTSCPENISLSVPGRKKRPVPAKTLPAKTHISQPCCFQHITSVGARDKGRYVSLQTLLPPSSEEKE